MSSNVETINYFAAIPGRALNDVELSGLDFRVIGVVAGHDRMGRNGQCCWASRDTMAKRVGCNPTTLSETLNKLCRRGYLERVPDPQDGRRAGYRVLYEQRRDAAGIGSRHKENRSAEGDISPSDRSAGADVSQADRSAKTDLSAPRRERKRQLDQCIKEAAENSNIFHEVEDILQKQKNTHAPPVNVDQITGCGPPRATVLDRLYGEGAGWNRDDGRSRLDHLMKSEWDWLIGLMKKGLLTDEHREWAEDPLRQWNNRPRSSA